MGAEEIDAMRDSLVAIIGDDDPRRLIGFVAGFPPDAQREETLGLLRQPDLEFWLMGLNMLALRYSRTEHAATALAISDAVGTVGRTAFGRSAEGPLLSIVAWAADIAAASRATLGRSDDLVAGAEAALRWLGSRGNTEKNCELHMWLAETHLTRGELARAGYHLQDAENSSLSEGAFGSRGRLRDLRMSYDRLAKQRSTELEAAPGDHVTGQLQSLADQLDAGAAHLATLPPDEAAAFAPVIGELRADLGAIARDPLGSSDSATERLADLLGASRQPSGPLGLQQRVREAGRMLVDPARGYDRAVLQQWIGELQLMADSAAEQGMGNELMTIWWCLQVCHRRCDDHERAVAVLRTLWESLETTRATIDDPVERAGVLGQFPHLFQSMAESLFLSGRPAELLEAIEGAKGRLLADVLERNRADVTTAQLGPTSLAALPAALENAGAHYLTYLVDDDCTYAVLVAKDRSMHAARANLDRATLRAYGASVDPSTWGRRLGGFLGPTTPSDLPDRLAPLVSWLEPLVAAGAIRADDHLCYCPDDDLHLIPLHLLNLSGAPLVTQVSLSRVHSARAVLDFLSASPHRPKGAAVVEVPAAEDSDDMAAGFARVGDRLLAHLPGERIIGEHATVERVSALDLADRVVHFTTHGTFPAVRNNPVDPNPFRSSGMLLAANGALPAKRDLVLGQSTEGLLSPELISELDVTGSHVTMLGCSTGLSKEGTGGDALGLEWALLLTGASSVVTAHWDVPLRLSSEFFLRFYDSWLVSGQSRAAAWRSTVLGMARAGAPREAWSGFSLAGDWR